MNTKLLPPVLNEVLEPIISDGSIAIFTISLSDRPTEATVELLIRDGYNNIMSLSNLLVEYNDNDVTFTFDDTLIVGLYYKIQVAFKQNNQTGYYSNVATAKYTTEGTLTYTNGVLTYQNPDDSSEKLQSYNISLGDYWQLSSEDLLAMGNTIFIKELCPYYIIQEQGSLQYTVKIQTNSGHIQYQTIDYPVYTRDTNTSDTLIQNTSNGYYDCLIEVGSGEILRSEDTTKWEVLPQTTKDFLLEHGKTYYYGKKEERTEDSVTNTYIIFNADESYTANFEDSFLFDGQKQLKIRFNPKVSSFKNDLQEQKIETMGSQYPYFYRNGAIKYKEFPISGLISYLMDDNEFFMEASDLDIVEYNCARTDSPPTGETTNRLPNMRRRTTQLSDRNIAAERKFKLSVLEWLNDGKIKLFKSPTEGNYLVRLMNVSLQPNDTLGRMIHTFSCTAYEVAEYNIENCKKYLDWGE